MSPAPSGLSRRQLLVGLAAGAGAGRPAAARTPVTSMRFPRDGGAHPDYGTEWWYITGWANVANQEAAYGFQLTFFRSRIAATQTMRSPMAARHLVFAHAAITDVTARRLWHDQRMARASGSPPGRNPSDLAWADTEDTGVALRDWTLQQKSGMLRARLRSTDFSIALDFKPTQPVLLQGEQGLSRKGPEAAQTSYYYSQPHLQVQGELELQGKRLPLQSGSTAWLDHEWSQEMLHPAAVGWDWIGINLFDGSALTAFQLRDRKGLALWDGGSFRKDETLYPFQRGETVFKPMKTWKSPRSQAVYPVEWIVRTPADFYTVRALVDNQELDSRSSTGAIYWEGLCEVWDSNQRRVGRGYLEMTGYSAPIRL